MWTVQPGHSDTSDRQLRAVIDSIPALVWLANTEGAAEYLNRRWREYTGLPQAQAVGWGWTVAVHPEDIDRLTNYWRSVLQSGVRGETEARLRRVDGEYGWFKFTAEPLLDPSGTVVGWCGTNIDIIEQVNRALQASERELALIIETIPAFVYCASTDGRLIYANKRLSEYLGASVDNLLGNGWQVYIHPDDRPAVIDSWRRAVSTGAPYENQYRLRRADGVYRWFRVGRQLGRTSDGQPTQWYGLLVDIEDRKNVEEALRRTESQLARAAQRSADGSSSASSECRTLRRTTPRSTGSQGYIRDTLAAATRGDAGGTVGQPRGARRIARHRLRIRITPLIAHLECRHGRRCPPADVRC